MLQNDLCLAHLSCMTENLDRSDRDNHVVHPRNPAKRFAKVLLGWALCAFLITSGAKAQIRSSTITGMVTDQKGAVIVGADVTVTNTGTNAKYSTTTTETGLYTIPYLAAGTYNVTVSKSGFAVGTVNGVLLNPSQIARTDVSLRVGETTAVVEVQATTEQLQTESSTLSSGVDARVVDSIPNITQNPLYYLTLQSNVQPRAQTYTSTTINSAGVGVAGRAELSAIGVNGGRAFENDIQLDGLPITGDGFNEMTIVPNQEGIQEVRVISNNFTADYGRGQSVMAMSTKSGTNAFHGQANYLLRNEALNANTWGNKIQGIRRPAFKRNNFGGAFEGPIKKDTLFFFSSYHYMRQNIGQTNLRTVPTALERTGDFTQTLQQGANGQPSPAQLFNPYSITSIGTDIYQRAPITPAKVTSALVPNPAVFTAALKMYSYYPMPNRTPDDVYNTNNFQSYTINTVRTQSSNNRVDFKHGRHSIYGSGGIYWDDVAQPNAFNVAPASTSFNNAPSTISDRNGYAQIGDTVAVNPTFLADVRYGVTRTHAINFGGLASGFTQYGDFGIPAATQALFAKPGAAPVVNPNFSGGSGGGSNWSALSSGQFANKEERQIGHAMVGSITKLHGNWTFKAGAEYRVILANYTDFEEGSANMNGCCAGDPGGNYSFEYVTATGGKTAQDNSPLVSGINGAAMLLGQGVWFVRPGANLKPAYAAKYFAVYSQNDWRVKPRLTLNLGLRWDLQPGLTERYNRLAGIDFTRMNPYGTMGLAAFPGTDGYSRNLWDTEYHDFQPRIGAAYQITRTMVVRGGFGISYLPSNTGYFSSPNDYGEASFAPGNQALPFGSTPAGMPVTEFTDAAPLVPAVGANKNAPENYGITEAYFNRHLKNQLVRQANLSFEKAFGASGQWLLSVGWSDAISRHLTTRNLPFQDLQSIAPAILSNWKTQYIASNGNTNPATVSVQNPYQPTSGTLIHFSNALANRTIQQFIPLLPYPMMYGGNLNGDTGFGNYNALIARLSHHFSSGLDIAANYTWSKELDYVTTGIEDGQGVDAGGGPGTPDLINSANNKNYGTADLPNRINVIVVYESPFGAKGKYALGNPVARTVAGDWMLSTAFLTQGGYPIYMSMGASGAITARMDRNPIQSLEVPKSLQHRYNGATKVTLPCGTTITPPNYSYLKYNLCAFQGETLTAPNGNIIPNIYWIGNAAQTNGNIRMPGKTNVDFTVRRTFPIKERFSVQIGAEISNLFNHPEFNSAYGGGMGNMNLTNNSASGLVPGIGSSSGFGTAGVGTYDPRQVVMHAFVKF